MFNNVIYDAVRVSERESRSALPNAPVVDDLSEGGLGKRARMRLAVSAQLRNLADLLEPAQRPVTETHITADSFGSC
jgi:hypothetical protein